MSPLRTRLLAVVATLAVGGAGMAYADGLEARYASGATIAASPSTDAASRYGIDFERSATVGTFVQLLTSPATKRAAGSPPIQVAAAAQPDTTVLRVVATGEADAVRPGLRRVIAAAKQIQRQTGDAFRMDVISAPSRPAATTTSPRIVRGGVIFAALLVGLTILIVPGRFGGGGEVWALEDEPQRLRFDAELVRFGPLTDSTSMLRVFGRWYDADPRVLGTPELLVDDGQREVRLPQARTAAMTTPLAAPDPEAWEAAFGVPASLFTRVGPPALSLVTPEGTFPLLVGPEVWRQSSPEALAPPAASTSS